MEGAAMFDVVEEEGMAAAVKVRGSGEFEGQWTIFSGPNARARPEAYARWMNAGGSRQRRRTDPGYQSPSARDLP